LIQLQCLSNGPQFEKLVTEKRTCLCVGSLSILPDPFWGIARASGNSYNNAYIVIRF